MAANNEQTTHITRLKQILLQWDYFGMVKAAGEEYYKKHKKIPAKFASVTEYLSIFEPLVLEECSAQILRGEEQAHPTHLAVVMHLEKTHQFHFATIAMEPGNSQTYAENDLVLISKERPKDERASFAPYGLGAVESLEGKNSLRVRFFLPEQVDTEQGDGTGLHGKPAEAGLRIRTVRKELQEPNSGWWITKRCNLSTIMREWVALHCLNQFPFKDMICSPGEKRMDSSIPQRNIPGRLLAQLSATHNESQLEAINKAVHQDPIVLIQGPPGTGKTRTILGLLSVLLQSAGSGGTGDPRGKASVALRGELAWADKAHHWKAASPWEAGPTPREQAPPISSTPYLSHWSPTTPPRLLGDRTKHKPHVLVCAPSNSALDEIVYRIVNSGLLDSAANTYMPTLVRVGVSCHKSVESVSMEELISQRTKASGGGALSSSTPGKKNVVTRDAIKMSILNESSIVCSTLAFSGSSMFARMTRKFDVVVIDEAAQAVEPSTFVPLCHGCKQLFLIGDPIQLPATVLSDNARWHLYDKSMFLRFQEAGYETVLLNTQYRMHPMIREFPSNEFYYNELVDGITAVEGTRREWHAHASLGPFSWLDVAGTEQTAGGSKCNEDEAHVCLMVAQHLMRSFPALNAPGQMAVISPYKQQVSLLRSLFEAELGKQAEWIDINTIDGFQGREKEVAIFSAVRSGTQSIGFVSDHRRMNVGLTRARTSMIVVGNSRTLAKHSLPWYHLVRSSKKRKCLFRLSRPWKGALEELVSGHAAEEVYSEDEWEDDAEDAETLQDAEFGALEDAPWEPQPEAGAHDDYDSDEDALLSRRALVKAGAMNDLVSGLGYPSRGVEDEEGGEAYEDVGGEGAGGEQHIGKRHAEGEVDLDVPVHQLKPKRPRTQ